MGEIPADGDSERASLEVEVRRARRELKAAVLRAYEALRASGLSSAQLSQRIGLGASTIRKLGSDGEAGWKPPSMATCEAIDAFGAEVLGQRFGLVQALHRDEEVHSTVAMFTSRVAAIERQTSADEDGADALAVAEYLEWLTASVNSLADWHPHDTLDEVFQDRKVSVSEDPPSLVNEANNTYDELRPLPRGEISWTQAVQELDIAVVLADAGFGKSWQVRDHTFRLASKLSRSPESHTLEFPILVHAAALARAWRESRSPVDAIVSAASLGLGSAHQAALSQRSRSELVRRLTQPAAPVVVMIDALDEVLTPMDRLSVTAALRWIAERTVTSSVRLILTSRAAGYVDPFSRGGSNRSQKAHYVRLGVLEEPQVRWLWRHWYASLGRDMPTDQLDAVLSPDSALRVLAHVPLIAAFCAWVAEDDSVATTRAGLFAQIVDRFLARPWNVTAEGLDGTSDPAARSTLHGTLVELAWHMASPGEAWSDSITPSEAEQVLAGSFPNDGHSLVFRLMRECGILVQPGVAAGHVSDAPVMWVHRSVHQFLVAKALIDGRVDHPRNLIEQQWLSPVWTDVLQLAVGLEAEPEHGVISSTLTSLTTTTPDPLGWYCTTLVAGRASQTHRPLLASEIHEQLTRQHAFGAVPTRDFAIWSARLADADYDALTRWLLSPDVVESTADRDRWEALTWCGDPGRASLTATIIGDAQAQGAASVLRHRDPNAAAHALRRRIVNGHPVGAPDAPVLRDFDPEGVDYVVDRFLSDVTSPIAAALAGYTRSGRAYRALNNPNLLAHEDHNIRLAALEGLTCWYGYDVSHAFVRFLIRAASVDSDHTIRIRARSHLDVVRLFVPWVGRLVAENLGAIHADTPSASESRTLDELAASLVGQRAGREKAITMLAEEPRLIRGPVAEALTAVTALALTGRLSATETSTVLKIGGADVIQIAMDRLRTHAEPHELQNLATGLCLASDDGDAQAFEALATYAGRHPAVLTEALLRTHATAHATRIHHLWSLATGEAGSPNRKARELWLNVTRKLLLELPAPERRTFRTALPDSRL